MDVKEFARQAMAAQGVTYGALAARTGIDRSYLGHALGQRQRSMAVDKAVAILGALGYDVVAVPVGSRIPSGAVVIGAAEDEG